jgi:hypothetical protein
LIIFPLIFPLALQFRDRGLDPPEHAVDVDRPDPGHLRRRDIDDGPDQRDAGVVDHDVEAA